MRYRSTEYTIQTEDARSNPRESFSPDGSSAEELINVIPGTIAGRQQADRDFLGFPVRSVDGSTVYLARTTPKPYDSFGNMSNSYFMYCTSMMSASPYGVATKAPATTGTEGPQARVTASYRDLPYLIREDAQMIAPGGGTSRPAR